MTNAVQSATIADPISDAHMFLASISIHIERWGKEIGITQFKEIVEMLLVTWNEPSALQISQPLGIKPVGC